MKIIKENWESTRKKGFFHFFIFRGILLFGLPFVLLQFLLKWNNGSALSIVSVILSGFFGAIIYSGSMWYFAERNYKKTNFKDKV
jgi:hypothetical protein